MSYLDFDDNYKPPYAFKKKRHEDRVRDEEERLAELNNLGREKVKEDFSDSPYFKDASTRKKPLK
jgi:hypothetical protein